MLWFLASAFACPLDTLIADMNTAYEAGRMDEALEHARARVDCATAEDTDVGQAWLELALVQEGAGDFEGSLAAWEQVITHVEPGPDRASGLLRVGLDVAMKGEFEPAFEMLEQAIDEAAEGAQKIDAQLWLARIQAKGGRPDDALALLDTIEPATPDDAGRKAAGISIAWSEIMHARREAGDLPGSLDAAFASLEVVKDTDGMDRVMAELAYGQRLIENGRPTESLPHLVLAQEAFANGAPGSEGDMVASSSLARAYERADRPKDALPYAERGVELAVAGFGADNHEAARARAHLAVVLHALGRDQEADDAYRSALSVMSASLGPMHPDTLFLEHDVLAFDMDRGQTKAALAGVEKLVAKWIEVRGPNHLDTISTGKLRCVLLNRVGRLAEAAACSTRARKVLAEMVGDHPMVVDALATEAISLQQLGDPREAIDRVRHAIDIQSRLEPDIRTDEALRQSLARFLNNLGQQEAALEALGKRPESRDNRVIWHLVRGEILAFSEPGKALTELGKGLELAQSPQNRSAVHAAMGFASLQLGRLAKAEGHMRASLAAAEEPNGPDDPRLVNALYNLAQVLVARNDRLNAASTLDRISVLMTKAGIENHPTLALCMGAVGRLLVEETPDDAIRLANNAVAMAEATLGPTHPDTAAIQLDAAATLHGAEKSEDALPYAKKASATYASAYGDTHLLTLNARENVATLQLVLGQAAEGYAELDTIDGLVAKDFGKRSVDRVHILSLKASAQIMLGELDSARSDSKLALDIEEDLLRTALATSERQRLAAVQRGQLPLGVYLQSEQDVARAYSRGLTWKGLASRAFLGQTEKNPELAEVRNQIAALAFSPPATMTSLERRDALEALSKRKDALQATVQADKQALDWKATCKALPDDAAVVDFFPATGVADGDLTSILLAFVLRGGDCDAPARVELDTEAVFKAHRKYRKVVASRGAERLADRVGAQLRAVLWDPLEPALDGRTDITVIPEASLANVSFAGLPRDDGTYLVEHFRLRMAGHLSEVDPTASTVTLDKALVVGGVEYSTEGETPDASERAGCGWASFGALPGALDEVKAIRKTLQKRGEVRQLVGAEASEANVREALGEASVVHLATHGFHAGDACAWNALGGEEGRVDGQLDTFTLVSGMNPMVLSGLALAGANDRTERQGSDDGVFTAEEVAGITLAADLVVLSACESGLGAVAPGEGVLGLQRGFRQAGAKRIVYSLWQVPDEATRDLMKAFYKALADGVPAAEALRQAQISVLDANRKKRGEGRPTDWAAFVLGG